MKIWRNLSNSLLRSEVFNRANKSFGPSIGLSFWRHLRLLIGFALCSVCLLLASTALSQSVTGPIAREVPPQRPGTWKMTSSMLTTHLGHTATLLPNGQVLVAGGHIFGGRANAELYDPATRVWIAAERFTPHREGHTATLLPNGQVLVAGGYNGGQAWRVRNFMIPRPACGPRQAGWLPRDLVLSRRSYPMARCSSQGDRTATLAWQVRNFIIHRPGGGPRRATWLPRVPRIPGRSCPTAKCSSQGETTALSAWRVRNYMIRRPGSGPRQAAWPLREMTTPRRSCSTTRRSSPGGITVPLSRARNCMTPRLGYGPRQAAWRQHESSIPRRFFSMGRCSSRGDLF